MASEEPKRPWEQQLRDAATHLETDLKNVVKYINDEVVPECAATARMPCEPLRQSSTSSRREWTTTHDGPPLPRRLQRTRRSRDESRAWNCHSFVGVRAGD